RLFILLLFLAGIFNIGLVIDGWPQSFLSERNSTLHIVFLGIAVLVLLLPSRVDYRRLSRVMFWAFAIVLAISMPFILTLRFMGVNDLPTLLHYFAEHSTVETGRLMANDYAGPIAEQVFAFVLFGVAAFVLYRMVAGFSLLILLPLTVWIVQHNPIWHYGKMAMFPPAEYQLLDYDDLLEDPQISFDGAEYKNLIVLYLESYERNHFDVPKLAPFVAPLGELKETSLEFANISQTYGTANSVSGVISSMCGIPFVLRNTLNLSIASEATPDQGFFTDIDCLPDVLSSHGYATEYFIGADLHTYSIETFLSSHGFDKWFGLQSATPDMLANSRTNWGLSDDVAFAQARDAISRYADEGRNFFIALSTQSTHGPDGFPDPECDKYRDHESGMPGALLCTAENVRAVVDHVQDLGLRDDTVIAVLSDHLAWPSVFIDDLEAAGTRRNLFIVLDQENPRVVDKLGLPFDAYPTFLELLGFEVSGRRAYFGRSLLADDETLAEVHGVETINAAFSGNMELSRRIWIGKSGGTGSGE
ncbi:MAG: sulfatase-like hydrolase/transferase, partial [Pseudomonadota bacterium]